MSKRRRLPDLADDQRCTRNGTNWRCHLPRLPGKSYCQKHQLFNLARSQSKSKSKSRLDNSDPNSSPIAPPSFTFREIWAFVNPLVYARIERKIPAESMVEVTPLIPPSPDAACGLFRTSEMTEMKDMTGFSHRVWFEMEGEGVYKILPRKGEIWAVEMYGWVEMVTSFVEGEGASGTVLVEDEEEVDQEEWRRVFRRRLHEGCELIRRFTSGELWMFLQRVSEAKVLEVQGLLEGCTIAIEGDREDALRIEDSNNLQLVCGTNLDESNMEQVGDIPEGIEGGHAQILAEAPSMEGDNDFDATGTIEHADLDQNLERTTDRGVVSHQTLEVVSNMEAAESYRTLEGALNANGIGSVEVGTASSSQDEAKGTDQNGQLIGGNLASVTEEKPLEYMSC